MVCTKLSEISDNSDQWTICVFVSRLWHFRGGTDEGPIKHTDLVLLDSEVSATALEWTRPLLCCCRQVHFFVY